tara:strand:- start:398 stop:604 length:207 start_codon:yes stop_codon:yes gene_type:complete
MSKMQESIILNKELFRKFDNFVITNYENIFSKTGVVYEVECLADDNFKITLYNNQTISLAKIVEEISL